GPSNLITLLESIPPYWESIRKLFYERMGDPNSPEGKALLMERSPLTSAGKIKTPLMVVQGANDPRVNRREAEQIVIALRDRGFPRSEEHTSELQSPCNLVCRLLLEKKKKI